MILDLFNLAVDIFGIVWGKAVLEGLKIALKTERVVKTVMFSLSLGEAIIKADIASWSSNQILEIAFDQTSVSWIYDALSIFSDVEAIANGILSDTNYYADLINYCTTQTNFDISVELSDGSLCKMQRIKEQIS